MPVTVPGSSTDVTVSAGSGDVLDLAAQIGSILQGIQTSSGSLNVATTSGSAPFPAAPTTPGATQELILSSPTVNGHLPPGYDVVVVTGSSGTPATVVGSDTTIISDNDGGTFFVSGTSTIAAGQFNALYYRPL